METLKRELLTSAVYTVEMRIGRLKIQVAEIQASANEDTKSVAGDKYETSRAMAHLEIEKIQTQQSELSRALGILRRIDASVIHYVAQLGSVVETSGGNFFLSTSLGELHVGGRAYTGISLASPLGTRLKGAKAGDKIVVHAREFVVQKIL